MEITVDDLFAKVGRLTVTNEVLTSENAKLGARVAELEALIAEKENAK